jgi:hypothetical protein
MDCGQAIVWTGPGMDDWDVVDRGPVTPPEILAAEAAVVAEVVNDALMIGDPDAGGVRVIGSLPDLAQFASNVSMAVHGGARVALDELIEVWGYADLAEEVAPALGCRAVSALIALLDSDGQNVWLRYHLLDCDDPDSHRRKVGAS